MGLFTSQKNLKAINQVEQNYDESLTRLNRILDSVEVSFIKMDVSILQFSKDYWTQLPLDYSRGVRCRGMKFDQSTKVMCRFDKGAYMLPHYYERSLTIKVSIGHIYLKTFNRGGHMTGGILLGPGEAISFDREEVYAPSSEEGCEFIMIWD